MALIKHGNNALSSVTAFPSAVPTGQPVLLSTATASSSSSISFTSGIDSTYDIYKWEFTSIHPATNDVYFTFQGSTNGGSSYGVTITSTAFRSEHYENDAATALAYHTSSDLAQSTSFQRLGAGEGIGNDNDQTLSGELYLFAPSSNTFVKHFMARTQKYTASNISTDSYIAGYFNDGSNDINAIQFKMSSGNIDAGTIKMYGISA